MFNLTIFPHENFQVNNYTTVLRRLKYVMIDEVQ